MFPRTLTRCIASAQLLSMVPHSRTLSWLPITNHPTTRPCDSGPLTPGLVLAQQCVGCTCRQGPHDPWAQIWKAENAQHWLACSSTANSASCRVGKVVDFPGYERQQFLEIKRTSKTFIEMTACWSLHSGARYPLMVANGWLLLNIIREIQSNFLPK